MKYLLALVCPPLALIACGRIYQAMFNAALAFVWIAFTFAPEAVAAHLVSWPPFALALFGIK
jgi:hypothetical protein